jgi:hypothetical protein
MNGVISQIQFTPQENQVLSLIEDVNDRLNKENMKNSKKGGAVEIAFMDLSDMSAASQALYLIGILAGLAGSMFMFYNFLVAAPDEDEKARLRKLEERKQKKASKKV